MSSMSIDFRSWGQRDDFPSTSSGLQPAARYLGCAGPEAYQALQLLQRQIADRGRGPSFIPLILWNADGWAAEFCDHCQATWFGLQKYDEPTKPRKDAS